MSKIVTFGQAKMLKELGFDEETHKEYRTPVVRVFESGKAKYIEREPYVYDTGRHASFYGDVSYENYISAPTVSEAIDWIREKFNLMCGVYPTMRPSTTIDNPKWAAYKWSIMKYERDAETGINEVEYIEINDWFDTHPLANSALLTSVLEYLIEKEK